MLPVLFLVSGNSYRVLKYRLRFLYALVCRGWAYHIWFEWNHVWGTILIRLSFIAGWFLLLWCQFFDGNFEKNIKIYKSFVSSVCLAAIFDTEIHQLMYLSHFSTISLNSSKLFKILKRFIRLKIRNLKLWIKNFTFKIPKKSYDSILSDFYKDFMEFINFLQKSFEI